MVKKGLLYYEKMMLNPVLKTSLGLFNGEFRISVEFSSIIL